MYFIGCWIWIRLNTHQVQELIKTDFLFYLRTPPTPPQTNMSGMPTRRLARPVFVKVHKPNPISRGTIEINKFYSKKLPYNALFEC
jgi:hypothetical protein